jgi:hypothetical protein
MSGSDPVSQKALQREIDELREQAMLLPPGRKRNQVLARADALEVTMKTFFACFITNSSASAPRYRLSRN